MENETDKIVFFDGDCLMCQGAVQWLHRLDRNDRLQFAPLQGETARRVGVSIKEDDSMAFLEKGEITRSALAVERSLLACGGGAKLLGLMMKLAPLRLREWVYRQIAKRRKIFQKTSASCQLPEEELKRKMLD